MQVQKLLEEHNYDTVGNFLSLYKSFKKIGYSNLLDFFPCYSPPITPEHHTCVGLALELWNRLNQLDSSFENLASHLFIVSCEENIEDLTEYIAFNDSLESAVYSLEKEHVLLCLKFNIAGREGLLLCDPGYHVGRVITVMYDNLYPQTGWFTQSEEEGVRKEYNYHFSPVNSNFIEWDECTTKNDVKKNFTGLIYTTKPYLTAVDVTERRNLVYNFRCLLSRDPKGHLIAGIYFKVKEDSDEFTMFYQNMGKQRIKMKFSSFKQPNIISEETLKMVSICNEQLNLQEDQLLKLLKETAELFDDKLYLQQILDIDRCVNILSADN